MTLKDIENRRFGDRRDGRLVRDGKGLQTIMANLMPNRTDCEVYLSDKLDCTELMKFLEEKNASHPEYKTTIFHAALTGIARIIRERPLMNRFIQGGRIYQRDDVSLSFVAKRRFTDGADEALMVIVPSDTDSLDEISRQIVGEVKETRRSEHATGGVDKIMDTLAKLPRPILMPIIGTIRIMDFWGVNPKFLTEGDPNYTTVLASNLGSIQCPSVYHHLNNYGTNSIMVTLGTVHKEEITIEDGHKEIRDVVDFGATLDERIGDGFYFARSFKLLRYIFAHPELLDKPLGEPSGFEYK